MNFELKSEDFISRNFRPISIYQKENYPLVQTDKGQYKAGDIVKFRILVLDHDLKPAEAKQVDEIWIEDPKNRRIQQWKEQVSQHTNKNINLSESVCVTVLDSGFDATRVQIVGGTGAG